MRTLLFRESPLLGYTIILTCIICAYYRNRPLLYLSLTILLLLLYFYRYTPTSIKIENNQVASPAEGLVTNIKDVYTNGIKYKYISIFLDVFNNHTQIYPVNGKVLFRYYDRTGVFNLVIHADKSRYNEKKMHVIRMNKIGNYTPHIQLSQIAGMLPRAIVSDDGLDYYNAGDYLGMIKFGSRVELFLSHCDYVRLNVKEGQKIKLGELIGEYVVR